MATSHANCGMAFHWLAGHIDCTTFFHTTFSLYFRLICDITVIEWQRLQCGLSCKFWVHCLVKKHPKMCRLVLTRHLSDTLLIYYFRKRKKRFSKLSFPQYFFMITALARGIRSNKVKFRSGTKNSKYSK